MAMIDYGALVFKNGKLINQNEFFMDMEKSVGWVDIPYIKTPNCDCFRTFNDETYSDCDNCPKAKFEMKTLEYDRKTETYRHTLSDCMGNSLNYPNKLNGNYFAYIGNTNFTLAIYKNRIAICIDKKYVDEIWWNQDKNKINHKSFYYTYNNITIHIKTILNGIYLLSVTINNAHYNVIYGYAIDPNLTVWNKIKVKYLGRKNAKKIDNLINKLWTKK